MSEWLTIADKYGWPALGLIIAVLFLWKGIWPIIVTRMNLADVLLKEQIHESNQRNDKLVAEFLGALDRKDKITADTVVELRRIADSLTRLQTK